MIRHFTTCLPLTIFITDFGNNGYHVIIHSSVSLHLINEQKIKHVLLCAFLKTHSSMSKFSEVIQQDKPVLVDFFADWCGPCKTMSPILKQVKDALGDTVSIIKINVDTNQKLSAKFQVKGVPTLILFKNGKQAWRQSGVVQKQDLISLLKTHL